MRLATFNIMHGRSLVDGQVSGARFAAAAASLDADILGLQEVDRNQPRSENLDLTAIAADALGAKHFRFVPAVVGTPGIGFRPATEDDMRIEHGEPEYGVALISRHPIEHWHITRLPPAPIRAPLLVPGPRGFRPIVVLDEPRLLIAAIVDAPSGRYTVATTHLSFVPGWNIWQLRRVIKVLRTLPAPRLLLGDLNLPATLVQRSSGWRSLANRPTYPSSAPRVQFDHVLLDPRGASRFGPIRGAHTPSTSVSDHRPFIVEF